MQQDPSATTDANTQSAQRRDKLADLRKQGQAYPNTFQRTTVAAELHNHFGQLSREQLTEQQSTIVSVAGRMVFQRQMGKASFATLQDMSGKIQVYLRQNDLPEGIYDQFKQWDLGDIIGVTGYLFKTKTGELSIHAQQACLITKSLHPMPDKFHGLHDQEQRYRQRYLDLIANEETRCVFQMRSALINGIRQFLVKRHFLEVETPMMQPIPGGATARPFITHHNTLDMSLYLRISPELYLKRLVVGGFERVFEINRSFRNEGISTRHNPEFTMLEFYQAYANYQDLMNLSEQLLQTLARDILGTTELTYQGHTIDLAKPFTRMTVLESIMHFNPELKQADLTKRDNAANIATTLDIPVKPEYGLGKIQIEIFEKTVEHRLIEPTFITAYPAEISPLARRNDDDPFITDRFELFIGGRELANGFSELNDPDDQAERFRAQVAAKDAGDMEAMHYDADYITALEYAMPPAAGEGIGIDRLVMLFTDMPSIRDVILFPQLRAQITE